MIRLLELRKEKGLSQREIAAIFKISQGTYNNWENSNTQPSIEQLIQLSRFFEVSVDYILGNTDETGTVSFVPRLSAEERDLLSLYSSLPKNVRSAFITILRSLAEKQ